MTVLRTTGEALLDRSGEVICEQLDWRVRPGERAAVQAAADVQNGLLDWFRQRGRNEDGDIAVVDDPRAHATSTVRRYLLSASPTGFESAGGALLDATSALTTSDPSRGLALAEAVGAWGEIGGYELEVVWSQALDKELGASLDGLGDAPVDDQEHGSLWRAALRSALGSGAGVVVARTVDATPEILELLQRADPTVFLLGPSPACEEIMDVFVTVGRTECWTIRGSADEYRLRADRREEQSIRTLRHWQDEERRLHDLMLVAKERASINSKNASRGRAAETRWKRFVATKPPAPDDDELEPTA